MADHNPPNTDNPSNNSASPNTSTNPNADQGAASTGAPDQAAQASAAQASEAPTDTSAALDADAIRKELEAIELQQHLAAVEAQIQSAARERELAAANAAAAAQRQPNAPPTDGSGDTRYDELKSTLSALGTEVKTVASTLQHIMQRSESVIEASRMQEAKLNMAKQVVDWVEDNVIAKDEHVKSNPGVSALVKKFTANWAASKADPKQPADRQMLRFKLELAEHLKELKQLFPMPPKDKRAEMLERDKIAASDVTASGVSPTPPVEPKLTTKAGTVERWREHLALARARLKTRGG